MVNYVYLGYGFTDSNGIAKLSYNAVGTAIDHSYTGTGAGEIDVVASLDKPIGSGSVVSQPYPVLDCLFMDYKGDGTKNTNWTKSSSPSVNYSDGETTISSTSNGYYFSNQKITGDFEAILEAKMVSGSSIRIGFANTNNTSFTKSTRINFNSTDYYYVRIKRVNNQWTFERSTNQESWYPYTTLDSSTLSDEDCYLFFGLIFPSGDTSERAIRYKNLKIYPI